MIRNTNDGSSATPYLRCDISAGTLMGLPPWSALPQGGDADVYRAVRAAGFAGIQGGDPKLLRSLGMSSTTGGRIDRPGQADAFAAEAKAAGHDCATLHVGWGMEADDETDRVVEDILAASEKHDFPFYIETHRATITQDMWRTVRLTEKFPGIRFNGDLSHWYTGLEMVYGGIEKKMDFIQPVLDRVRFIHGRIGNPGAMQVDIGDGTGRPYVDHFREMWTRCFMGFLRSAAPGDYICFTPELLWSNNYYARLIIGPDGLPREECDRWGQALLYKRIAQDCFDEARRRLGEPISRP
jgi:hypothetical protein